MTKNSWLPNPEARLSPTQEQRARFNVERHGVPYIVRVCDFCRPQDFMSHPVVRYITHVNSGYDVSACADHSKALDLHFDSLNVAAALDREGNHEQAAKVRANAPRTTAEVQA